MKLWLLQMREDLPLSLDPWISWYDKAAGFVVRAETEADAREIASSNAGDEKRHDAWRKPEFSTCVELLQDGQPGMVLCDFMAA